MARSSPNNRPEGKFRFAVEITGLTVAHFQSVSGLSHEVEVFEHTEGGRNDRTVKLPGQGKYPNIVLKIGYTTSDELERWHRDFLKNRKPRKDVSIILRKFDGTEIKRWNFSRAWPVKWEGPELDSTQSQIAVESLELAHDGLV